MRKICVITGTRAEYGLLYHLLREIQMDVELKLQLIVTGMHLSPEFGLTYKIIEKDGFPIDEKIEMLLSGDTPTAVAKSIGLGVIGMADALARLQPDIMVALGDRYEMFAAAQAALVLNIPVAHIHGGEVTEGAIDEAMRHSMTKMSQLHFVSAEAYRKRVLQLGESQDSVFCFGSPGQDRIRNLQRIALKELEEDIGFLLGGKFFLFTYHPVTTELERMEHTMREIFGALSMYPEYKVLITKSNADAGGRMIGKMLDAYAKENSHRVFAAVSLGEIRYLNAMRLCSAVIGNSSSGLLEAPFFRKPTVNIGIRQKGRLRMDNVIDCSPEKSEIISAIRRAVSPELRAKLENMLVPDMGENVSFKIKQVLKTHPLQKIIQKRFVDCISYAGLEE